MGTRRWIWVVVAVVGSLMTAAGLVWLFIGLGTEAADRISSGIGAGAALVGVLLSALGFMKTLTQARRSSEQADVRADPPDSAASAFGKQSVRNSTIMGANVQVGGSVSGGIAMNDGSRTDQDNDGHLASEP